MILVVDEKQPDCKNKQPRHTDSVEGNWSYYCACEFSSYHRMMDGMCCSGDDKCGCCWTDPIISKLPRTTTFSMYHGMRYGAKQNQGSNYALTKSHKIPSMDDYIADWYWVPRWVPPTTGELWKHRMFSWLKKNTADMVGALDKDQKCKDKPIYCACDPLHFDQIMKGMCCDKSTRCECCQTDPTLSKMKKMVQDPKTSSSCKDQIKANFGKKPAFCQWTEGWKQSAECCDEDYKLVIKDDRYDQQKVLLTLRYASIEGKSRHHLFCDKRLPWIYPGICSFGWYWVPKSTDGGGG
uniref:Uncharacterized protein n=2 Tax=Globodera pallida TaxID=36090 RepID=A0A183CNR2_GLOPA